MFKSNKCQQFRLDDPVNLMPKYLKEILEKSWAQIFKDNIFPSINEERFKVLYSNKSSRPNSPVNVIVGLLIIKEYFKQSDEELIGSLFFDDRYQYALNTRSFKRQPISINTLTNFRKRVYEYEIETGIDLIKEEIESISSKIMEKMNIDGNMERMDSLMVSSNCKKLSRIELVYMTNFNYVKALSKIDKSLIAEECRCYLEEGHKNETVYRMKNTESESKLEYLLKHSKLLYETGLEIIDIVKDLEPFILIKRVLKDQTNYEEIKDASPKQGSEITPDSLQNPSDPDATYRKKYGDNVGYSANVVEKFDDENSIITDYDLKENTYDDSRFAKDVLEKKSSQEEELQLLVDGAFYSQEISDMAKEKNIKMIPGELRGRKPSEDKIECSKFKIDENENIIKECPSGKNPVESTYNTENDIYRAKFSKDDCENCPVKNKCRKKEQKKYNVIEFSQNQYKTSVLRAEMNTKEYVKLKNKRAGVEGIPSVLRRRYNVDAVPTRGKVRLKFWFGFKIAAYNFSKLVNMLFFTNILLLFIKIKRDFFNKWVLSVKTG